MLGRLDHIWKRVGELAGFDPRFGAYLDARDGIKAQLDDLALTLRDFADGIDASPGRLQEVEDRLALLERLKRKHGPTLDEVIARRDALAAEHAALTGGSSSPGELEAALSAAAAAYLDLARDLSRKRHRMPRSSAAGWRASSPTCNGKRPRRGASSTPRTAMPSGPSAASTPRSSSCRQTSERTRACWRASPLAANSRVMLALKTLDAAARDGAAARTLIFDEVDAGIGGRVASMVGQKLAALGERHQVLCITHLPQVAACGRTHFLIQKATRGRRTVTTVRTLSGPERVDELARMMGGADAGEKARAGAQELLDAARAKGEQTAKAKGESPRGRKQK
ncbi:MAG: hypothetical protein R2712_11705 [Vicinamibacterales bacterium]